MADNTSPLDDFKLSDEEALVLAVAKYWLMSDDARAEKHEERREVKKAAVVNYRELMRGAFDLSRASTNLPEPTLAALVARLGQRGWAPAVRRALADCELRRFDALVLNWTFVSKLMETVKSRDRSVLLTIELLCFHPWPPKVKFDKGLRQEQVDALAKAFYAPIGHDYVREIDHEIVSRARRFALRLGWKRIALVAVGAVALGAVTGGLGAAAVGGAIGGTMGLSGAAAVNAGLAFLGGGSLAAGGLGVAGGTMVVVGAAGASAGAAAGGGAAMHAMSASDVLADMVKVDVLAKYVVLREQSEPQKVRKVVVLTEKAVRDSEREAERLRVQIKNLSELKHLADASVELVKQRENEVKELKEQLKTAEASAKLFAAEASSLRSQLESYEQAA